VHHGPPAMFARWPSQRSAAAPRKISSSSELPERMV
jgi:hypothetical protein